MVLIPEKNRKDLEEIPPKVLKGVELIFVHKMEDVFSHAFANGRLEIEAKK